MSAEVKIKWREPSGSLLRVVVCKLEKGQQRLPIGSVDGIDKAPQHVLHGTVGTLGLAICLGMVGGANAQTAIQQSMKLPPELTDKL